MECAANSEAALWRAQLQREQACPLLEGQAFEDGGGFAVGGADGEAALVVSDGPAPAVAGAGGGHGFDVVAA